MHCLLSELGYGNVAQGVYKRDTYACISLINMASALTVGAEKRSCVVHGRITYSLPTCWPVLSAFVVCRQVKSTRRKRVCFRHLSTSETLRLSYLTPGI
jgi:hypothetical protein